MSNQYKSKFEVSFAKDLSRRKIKFKYETESFEWIPKPRKYTPDFIIHTKSGKKLYIECKGKLDADTKLKMRCIKEQYPDVDIRIVFMRSGNKVTKRSKTTYGDWAMKNGYLYSEGTLPQSWLDE